MYIEINNKKVCVYVKYSKRKTLSLRVISKDSIEIRSPYGINNKILIDFVMKNKGWIINELNKSEINPKEKLYKDGEKFLFKGRAYKLKTKKGCRNFVCINESDKIINLIYKKDIKPVLIKWYKEQAAIYITERLNYYQEIMKVRPEKITIKNQKTIWGSCSSKKNLNFNLKLIMMPDCIIDYVIVHEICHLVQFNHSKDFWKEVENIIPDYSQRRKYLKEEGRNFYL